jgi:hypothetical protein
MIFYSKPYTAPERACRFGQWGIPSVRLGRLFLAARLSAGRNFMTVTLLCPKPFVMNEDQLKHGLLPAGPGGCQSTFADEEDDWDDPCSWDDLEDDDEFDPEPCDDDICDDFDFDDAPDDPEYPPEELWDDADEG